MTLAVSAATKLIELLGLPPIQDSVQTWPIEDVMKGAEMYLKSPDTSTYFWVKANELIQVAKAGRAKNHQCLVSV